MGGGESPKWGRRFPGRSDCPAVQIDETRHRLVGDLGDSERNSAGDKKGGNPQRYQGRPRTSGKRREGRRWARPRLSAGKEKERHKVPAGGRKSLRFESGSEP